MPNRQVRGDAASLFPRCRPRRLLLLEPPLATLRPGFNRRAFSFRLRRRLFDKALGRRSLPAQPPADQRDPQRERGARRALGRHHRPHAGPQAPGPVFDGAPGEVERERRSLRRRGEPDADRACVCVFCHRGSWRRSSFSLKTATRIRKGNLSKPRSRSRTS